MATLIDSGFIAVVVWLGKVANRHSSLDASACQAMSLRFAGPEGQAHRTCRGHRALAC